MANTGNRPKIDPLGGPVVPWGDAGEALGRQRSTGKDKRFWERLGIEPRKIAGRWVIALADLQRLTKPDA